MKHLNAVRLFLLVALFGASFSAEGQIHPLAFGPQTIGGTATSSNWYKDYVGLRFEFTSPVVIGGEKQYTTSNDGSGGTGMWGGVITSPIVNQPIVMDTTSDSFGGSTFSYSMAGKIALLWRGPIGSAGVLFSDKALHAQQAGAMACILINEFPGQGPVGMAAGASGPSVTIPVFMISNTDGIAISAQYHDSMRAHHDSLPTNFRMNITPWGLGYRNDVGFVPGGAAGWHSYAVPKDQLLPGATLPYPYIGLDGAFIANYGSSDALNVKLAAALYYTPNGVSTHTLLHADTASGESVFYGLSHTPKPDSIMAMFTTPEYSFAPSAVAPGRYDLTYTISSDTATQNKFDTSLTLSFYTTDSIYSKGRYDFANVQPLVTIGEGAGGGTDFVWGNMFYVAHGHDAARSVQFTIFNPNGTLGAITASPMNLYLFKWTDTASHDSLVENGELSLVGQGGEAFGGVNDTSGVIFTVPIYVPSGLSGIPVYLDSNSWYYIAAEVPAGFFLGCDGGATDYYPRMYGKWNKDTALEYTNIEWGGDYQLGSNTMVSQPAQANAPCAFPQVAFVNSVDSFNYAGQKGLVPAISLIVTSTPDTANVHVGVNGVAKPFASVNVYPNPADDYLNISVSLDQQSPTVSYTVIDGLGRFVSKETHYNVLNETYKMSTSKLTSGNYFLVVNANGRVLSKKFTIVR